MSPMRGRYDTAGAFRPAVRPDVEAPPRRGIAGWLRGALTAHLGLKVLALLLTLTVLLLVGASDEEREIGVDVDVQYVMPQGKVLVSERPERVRVQIKGPWRLIKRFDERELGRITLDLSKERGGEITIGADKINVPDGLHVTSISPSKVRVAFEDMIEKEVEVLPVIIGRPAHGYAVVSGAVRANPPVVVVRGPRGVVSAMSQVRTQDIDVADQTRAVRDEVTLLPPEGVDVDWKDTVEVMVPIAGRWIGTQPVVVVGEGFDAARLAAEPREVEIELLGAREAIDRLVAGGVRPTVRVSASAQGPAGAMATVAVDGVPSGVQVVVRPSEVRIAPKR
jgi:YbbR domain-containing protein